VGRSFFGNRRLPAAATCCCRLLPCSINNVSHVGHAHPRVAQAVAQQLMTLNTNSRYLDQGLVDYCEALAGLMPDPLQASRGAELLAGLGL
jgi:4-aminobutyrate aminotransferase-like enzyme